MGTGVPHILIKNHHHGHQRNQHHGELTHPCLRARPASALCAQPVAIIASLIAARASPARVAVRHASAPAQCVLLLYALLYTPSTCLRTPSLAMEQRTTMAAMHGNGMPADAPLLALSENQVAP